MKQRRSGLREMDTNLYRLYNSPFYARGFSFGDVVRVATENSGFPTVRAVAERSGHSTYRLFVFDGANSNPAFTEQWTPLQEIGCSFEGVDKQLLAVDVPPSCDIHAVYSLFEAGEESKVWDFEEAHCGHAV